MSCSCDSMILHIYFRAKRSTMNAKRYFLNFGNYSDNKVKNPSKLQLSRWRLLVEFTFKMCNTINSTNSLLSRLKRASSSTLNAKRYFHQLPAKRYFLNTGTYNRNKVRVRRGVPISDSANNARKYFLNFGDYRRNKVKNPSTLSLKSSKESR